MKRRNIYRGRSINMSPVILSRPPPVTKTDPNPIQMRYVKRKTFDAVSDQVNEESRFPKLHEFDHFHYEHVELGPLRVSLSEDKPDLTRITYMNSTEDVDHESCIHVQHWFNIMVQSNGHSWTIRRSYQDFCLLVKQLHECVYDGKYSPLNRLPESLEMDEESIRCLLRNYLDWFSHLAGNFINCAPVLNWLELDNRGNRLIVTRESAINTPAIAAAIVIKRYSSQASDELSFEVGDMISVIEMAPEEHSYWWRGKKGFEVGFFPSECVQLIRDEVPSSINFFPRRNLNTEANNKVHIDSDSDINRSPMDSPSSPKQKSGRFVSFLRSHVLNSRPFRRNFSEPSSRVFGHDLVEHCAASGSSIPPIVKICTEFIEKYGVVDGIYRLSGVNSNIAKLRDIFSDDGVPEFDKELFIQDIHCVASLCKMYFRELPDPLLTYELYDKFVASIQPISDNDPESEDYVPEFKKLEKLRDLIRQLPLANYRTLEYLVRHLARMASHSSMTGMTIKNMAIVWAPNLLRSHPHHLVQGLAALHLIGVQAVLTEYLIRYVDHLFNQRSLVANFRPKSFRCRNNPTLLSLEEARNRWGVILPNIEDSHLSNHNSPTSSESHDFPGRN